MSSDLLRLRFSSFSLAIALFVSLAVADEKAKIPSSEEVKALVAKEPFTEESWPVWRERLLSWKGDRSRQTDNAFSAAREFMVEQALPDDKLPPWLAEDAVAWYLLGSARLRGTEQADGASRAEAAFRQSLAIDASFARAHRNLAMSLAQQAMARSGQAGADASHDPRLAEAQRELDEAARLEPDLPLDYVRGFMAWSKRDFVESERRFRAALSEQPTEVDLARMVARSISYQRHKPAGLNWADAVQPLVDRFPEDGDLRADYALALARDGRYLEASDEIGQARRRGADPAKMFGPAFVSGVRRAAWPYLAARYALWGVAIYLGVLAFMAGFGVLLARSTRGARALKLLGDNPVEFVQSGQVMRSGGESLLARFYMLLLMAGLIFFYVTIPFLAVGMIVLTAGLLYGIFMLPRIPVKLVVIILIVGLSMAWSIIKSIFARSGKGSFGLVKTDQDCPRLHATVRAVAERVATRPVDEIYLAPGSEIGVHQEGRGPFGIFGVKRRVLTLGVSTMRYLSVSELKAILAHEYAHFSHKDTFYSRFIHQVTLSIEQALTGMAQAAGKLNYVNPFYWALLWYYRAYSLLAAGFSRSREFLADRMAVSLYGKDAFIQGLTKVATEGTLFDKTMFQTLHGLLAEDKAFTNMYETFSAFRSDESSSKLRGEVQDEVTGQHSSLFASHPTFAERLEAVSAFPDVRQQETEPALTLFEEPEKVEQELTEFYTSFVAYIRQLQAVQS